MHLAWLNYLGTLPGHQWDSPISRGGIIKALSKEKAAELLKDVDSRHYFILKSSRPVKNLDELASALERMEESEFTHHVSHRHNDFRNWIDHCVKDHELSSMIGGMLAKKAMLATIRKKLGQLRMALHEGESLQAGLEEEAAGAEAVPQDIPIKGHPGKPYAHGTGVKGEAGSLRWGPLQKSEGRSRQLHQKIKELHQRVAMGPGFADAGRALHKYDHPGYLRIGASEFLHGLVGGIIIGIIIARFLI